MEQIIGTGEAAVKVVGLKKIADKKATFDGITLMLFGGAVENFSDLTITGGANNVRRVIWQGEAGGVNRNAVLIVDNDGDGTLKGGWLILGNEQNVLTYYTDAAKISTEEDAAITLQFPDKKSALTPRRFTFIEKTSAGDGAILSIGAAFDDVTITAGASNPIYLSRTTNGSTLNGVLQPKVTAKVNSEQWKFDDADSFIVDGEKIFIGGESFDCAADLAACQIKFGKVLSETTAIKLADVHYDKNSKSLEIRKEQKKMAWTRTDDGGFAYNEGSLHYTLTGGAFHDNDGDGVPDGVTFENGRSVFMGIKNLRDFHFDVPRGYIVVNGNEYKLVDLDKNPDNGYELVVPEVQGKLGWSKNADGGFVYKRLADNNPDVMGGLTLYGKDLVDTNGDEQPDGVEVKTIIIGKMINGRRITQIGIEGLHGEVFLNHPEAIHSFGVKGDSNYNILITKDNGNLAETLFTNISPNSTINITNDTIVIETDGNGAYNFTGNGKFKLNDDFITLNGGERELKVKVKNGKIKSIDGFTDEDVVKVSKSGNIRINGQKITLTANTDMDMYGKPARASGADLSGDSSGDSAESSKVEVVAGETQELTKTESGFEYKSEDVDAETETADLTITAENVDADAVTFELVQKVLGTDKQEVDNLNGEIKLDGQPPVINAENQIDTSDDENTLRIDEIPAIELFDATELFDVSATEIFTSQEKIRLDTSETEYLQNLQLEEILPAKNIGADFVLNSEFKFNSTLADSSQCRKQELIDFERKIQGSKMDRQ